MIGILVQFSEAIYYALPVCVLFFVFLIGYWLAWTDFKPTKVTQDEYFNFTPKQVHDVFEPAKKLRELNRHELGIHDIDDTGALPAEDQKRLRMEEIIREFSSASPEETANIIKGWLSER